MAMNMQQVMKQARKMQEQMLEAQERMKDIEVSSSAGGGTVTVTAPAAAQSTAVTIDPEALDPEDVDFLQDMILAAVNEALASAQEVANKQLGAITGGMGMPGMF